MCDVTFPPNLGKIATSLYKIIAGDSQTHIHIGVWDVDYNDADVFSNGFYSLISNEELDRVTLI